MDGAALIGLFDSSVAAIIKEIFEKSSIVKYPDNKEKTPTELISVGVLSMCNIFVF